MKATWYEHAWLQELLEDNAGIPLTVTRLLADAPPPEDTPIVVIQNPYVEDSRRVLARWAIAGVRFYILHLSDENLVDNLAFYHWRACLGVVRTYARPNLPAKVHVIPLGYHWALEPTAQAPTPLELTSPSEALSTRSAIRSLPSDRDLSWSFVGTNWAGRDVKLAVLAAIVPGKHRVFTTSGWNAPNMLGRTETLELLHRSLFIPCPRGNNAESFRLYEALQAGAVPVLVREAGTGTEELIAYAQQWLPLRVSASWEQAAQMMTSLIAQPALYASYQRQLAVGWRDMKADARDAVRQAFQV